MNLSPCQLLLAFIIIQTYELIYYCIQKRIEQMSIIISMNQLKMFYNLPRSKLYGNMGDGCWSYPSQCQKQSFALDFQCAWPQYSCFCLISFPGLYQNGILSITEFHKKLKMWDKEIYQSRILWLTKLVLPITSPLDLTYSWTDEIVGLTRVPFVNIFFFYKWNPFL